MPLSAGTKFGPYEIVALLGAGGMGEVYRAHDTKLGRDVAIKVLPETFAHDAERMARFEREAQVLASLNHPHIATIYGLEESNEIRALVMELVEGPTLSERIGHHAMPLEEALPIAKQIAEGLEYAHERGIIHRDLKPANVKLTADGNVKILDFGLAKALETPVAQGNPSISPTLTLSATQAGVILGTAAYMAPEQARGAVVDKRADIWAFGVVLYEMLTGKQPFAGPTVSDTLAAVLRAEPDWEEVPLGARQLVKRCLAKDPRLRLRDIGDVRILWEQGSASAVEQHPAQKPLLPWAVAALMTAAALSLGALLWRTTQPVSRPLVRFDVELPQFANMNSFISGSTILSPDGARLVYTGRGADGTLRLYTRLLDQEQATPLSGTEGAFFPFFSPDGQSIGFFTGGKLKKTSATGGGTVELGDAPDGRGGSWGEDGDIIFAPNVTTGLSRVSSSGGATQPATEPKKNDSHRWPQVLPGTQVVLFSNTTSGSLDNTTNATIELQSLRTGERKTLVRGGHYGRYVASGHLLYMRQGTLYAAPMDLKRLQLTGPAVPVVEGVAGGLIAAFAQMDVSRSGTLVYKKGSAQGASSIQTLAWLESTGSTKALRPVPAKFVRGLDLRISPDGKRLAMTLLDGSNSDVWVYEWERDTLTRLTVEPGYDGDPKWTPDGKHIVFTSDRNGGWPPNLYWMRADGSGEKPVRLTESTNEQHPNSFSPDGKRLAFTELGPQGRFATWTLSLETADSDHPKAGKPEPFLQTPFNELYPRISPDGQWVAHVSDESGSRQIYVRRFPGPGGKLLVSNERAAGPPVWSRKSPELFYATSEGIMVVTYRANGDTFEPGKPRLWAAKKNLGVSYDLAPDGKRFAIAESAAGAEEKPDSHVTFLFNFFDELRRRAPAGGK